MIKAPFNFVPLSDKVFFPSWAKSVNHDIPFQDGESGEIDITFTAKSPIFIRNNNVDDSDEKFFYTNKEGNKISTEFCYSKNSDGSKQYYIPGSSVKGMIRNVLEIMSFSKMSNFNDDTYAVRDLSSSNNLYMTEMKKDIFCGWLKKDGDDYFIKDCGIPGRIRHEEIDKALNIKFAMNFKSNKFNAKNLEEKTSQYKYDLIGNRDRSIPLSELFTSKTNAKHDKRKFYNYKKNGRNRATLVLTGQPTARKDTGKMGDGKGYEFLFFESKEKLKIIDKKIIDNFSFAYFDGRKTQPKESENWTYWKEKLNKGNEVPVFFQKDNDEIIHIGLSYLYKLPYKYSIKNAIESISKEHFDKRLDLAQTIFGFIDGDEKKALKGRVQFSHFKADKKPEPFKTMTKTLGKPRASYYPIYIKQDCQNNEKIKTNNYNTLMDKDSKISGRKRYPLHQGKLDTKSTEKTDSSTMFNPLGNYADDNSFNEFTFSGKLRYHNLKKVELGAILSALTFHGNSSEFYHNIGMAKPYGFGKISVKSSIEDNNLKKLLKEYEFVMNKKIDNWLETEQIKELFTMANKDINIDLNYLTLDPTQGKDDFKNKKNTKECLPLTSCLTSLENNKSKSYLDDSQKDALQSLKVQKAKLEKIEEQQELLSSTPDSKSQEFEDAIKNFVIPRAGLVRDWYTYEDLSLLLNEREDDIRACRYDAYINLTENEQFLDIEKLLIKRDQNKADELELAKLYSLLIRD